MTTENRANYHIKPEMPRSLIHSQIQAHENAKRELVRRANLSAAQEFAETLGIPFTYKPVSGPTIVYEKNEMIYPDGRNPIIRETNSQK